MTIRPVSAKFVKLTLTSFLFSLPLFLMALFFGATHQVFADEMGEPITSPITIPISGTSCTPKPPCAKTATGSACRLPTPTPIGGWCN